MNKMIGGQVRQRSIHSVMIKMPDHSVRTPTKGKAVCSACARR